MIDDPEVEAVAIATPAATHFALARRALLRGKHVLVEKPMCASVAEARELVALGEKNGVTLMVDHTYLFHGAVEKLRQLHQDGSLGAVSYYDSLRVNLGLFQPDLNVLWDLGRMISRSWTICSTKIRSTSRRRDIATSTLACPISPMSRCILPPTPSRIST